MPVRSGSEHLPPPSVRRRVAFADIARLGLAVSGGADSTALATIMASIRRRKGLFTCIVRCDHGAAFGEGPGSGDTVRALARRLGLPLFEIPLAVRRRRGESPEMAARRMRLDAFRALAEREKLDAVATGHHADDVAETLVLRLMRGGGARGLSGLRPDSRLPGLRLVRPLIGFTHSELVDYLRSRGIAWREDPSNCDESIARNRIRRLVIPWLERNFDPAIRAHLAQSAELLREDDAALDNEAEKLRWRMTGADGELVPSALAGRPKAVRRRAAVLFLNAAGRTAGFREVEAFLAAAEATADAPEAPPASFTLNVSPCVGIVPGTVGIGKLPADCSISAAAVAGRTLEIRPRRPGDRIAPVGFAHSRKLQDVFVDAKTPRAWRDALPVLADAATGEVVWVPGYRIARSVAVPSDTAPSYKLVLSAGNPGARKRRAK